MSHEYLAAFLFKVFNNLPYSSIKKFNYSLEDIIMLYGLNIFHGYPYFLFFQDFRMRDFVDLSTIKKEKEMLTSVFEDSLRPLNDNFL